jgi:hypothetical protein
MSCFNFLAPPFLVDGPEHLTWMLKIDRWQAGAMNAVLYASDASLKVSLNSLKEVLLGLAAFWILKCLN